MAFLDIESSKKSLIRAGAIAFLLAGILIVILKIVQFLFLFIFVSKESTITYGISTNLQAQLDYALITTVHLPSTAATEMPFIVNNLTYYQIGYPLGGVISLILIIGIPALYASLGKIRPTTIALASLFALIFLVVKAQGWAIAYSLINTSLSYVHSTSDFQRAAYIAVFQSTLMNANAYYLVSHFVLGLAYLTFSVVMLKSKSLEFAGIFGIVSALFGLIAGWINVGTGEIGAILQIAWFFMLANSLWRAKSDARYKLPTS